MSFLRSAVRIGGSARISAKTAQSSVLGRRFASDNGPVMVRPFFTLSYRLIVQ